MPHRNRNLANSAWNIADILLYPVFFFLSVPVFIDKLGVHAFGIWMLVNTIIVSMQVFNFGIGPSVLKNIAHYTGLGDKVAVRSIVNYSISINLILFVLSVFITVILALMVDILGIWNIDALYRETAAWCIGLSGLIIGLRFIEQVFTNYYKGLEQYREAAFISTGNRVLPLLINVILLYAMPVDIIVLLSVIIGCNVVLNILAYWRVERMLLPYHFSFTLQTKMKLSRFAIIIWIQSLAMLLIFQADRYLILNYFGLSALSYYALTATIFNHLHMGFNAVFGWLSPKFTKLQAAGADTASLYFSAQYLLISLSVPALILFYLVYPVIFPLVLGNDHAVQLYGYIPYFIIFELFFVTSIVPAYYMNAIGLERKFLYFVLLFSFITLTSMLVSIHIVARPEAVLYGLIAACLLSVGIQHYLIELWVFKTGKKVVHSIRLLLPSFLAGVFIYYTGYEWRWLALAACLISIYFLYIKSNISRFQILLRS